MAEKRLLVRLGMESKAYERGMKRARRELKDFRKDANVHMKRAALAFGAVAAASVTIGARFEQAMAEVGAVANANAKELAMLEESARKMGATTSYSAQQAAEAQKALAAAGQKTHQIIASLPAVLAYAGSQNASLEESARATTAALNAFQLGADQANRVVNVFAAATANSDLQIDNLAEAMSNVSATANSLGFSLEETTAALGVMANAGIKGGKAGTKLQAVMLKMYEVAQSGAGAIGSALAAWDPATEGLAGAIKRLEEAGVTGTTALAELGNRGGPVLAAFLAQGSGALEQLTGSVTGSSRAFSMFERVMNTTIGQAKGLLSALQEAALKVYKALEGQLKKALDALTVSVRNNTEKIGAFAQQVADFLGGVFKFVGWLYKHREWVEAIAFGIGAVTVALYAMAAAQAAVNIVTSANPVVAILKLAVLVIAGLSAWIYKLIKDMGGWNIAWIKAKGFFLEYKTHAMTGLKTLWAGVKFYGRVWAAVGLTIWEALKAGWEYIKRFASMVKDAFAGIGKMITQPWNAKETWNEIKESLGRGFGDIGETVSSKVSGLWSGITDEYREEMKNILLEHGLTLAEIERITQQRIKDATQTASAGAGPVMGAAMGAPGLGNWVMDFQAPTGGAVVPEAGGSGGGEPGGDAPKSLSDRLQETMVQPYQTAWDSIIQIEMDGKQRRMAIWDSFKQSVWAAIGDQMKAHLWAEDKMTEGTQKSVLKRIGLKAKEMLSDMKGAATSIYSAVAGFFKAHASIPFVGAALAGAAVALMFGALRKAKPRMLGGPVEPGQPYLVGEKGPEVRTFGSRGSIISNRDLKAAVNANRPVVKQEVHIHNHGPVFADEHHYRNLKQRLARLDLQVS